MRNDNIKILCISGKAQHGKDTAAELIANALQESGQRVLVIHNADLLKYICKSIFKWDGNKDEAGRQLLQYIGTDVVRTERPDFWVEFIVNIVDLFGENWDYALIPDCRFPNELQRLVDSGYSVTHVRVKRDNFQSTLTKEQMSHPSETALDTVVPDVILFNNGTIDDLNEQIHLWLTKGYTYTIASE